MQLANAQTIAEWVRAELAPACEQIVIGGSVRRRAPYPNDLEVICIPKAPPPPTFGRPLPKEPLTNKLAALEMAGSFIGLGKNGDRYKNFMVRHAAGAMQLYLFICRPPMQWGWLLVLRTGPADFTRWLVTNQSQGGALPDDMKFYEGQLWQAVAGGYRRSVPMPDEESVFAAVGIAFRPPHQRLARWSRKAHA